jgi:hypothetical protein
MATTAPKPGAGLEGCPYAKKQTKKVVRMLLHPNHFPFLLLFPIFFLLIP